MKIVVKLLKHKYKEKYLVVETEKGNISYKER